MTHISHLSSCFVCESEIWKPVIAMPMEKNQYELSSRQIERDVSKMMRNAIGCKPPAYQN